MKRSLTIILLFLSVVVNAQNYKWIRGGGSISDMGGSIADWDQVSRMTTDVNKNVYTAGLVGDNAIKADTFYKVSAHYGGHGGLGLPHIFFASYNCEGKMRWGKLIEGDFLNQVYDLEYDGGSSVYLAGITRSGFFYSPIGPKYFGYDTIVNSGNFNMFLARYDTSGKLIWLRFIGPDSASTFNGTAFDKGNNPTSGLQIDGQGNIHYYAHLMNNVRITPIVVSTTGNYDIKYDTSGNITNVTRLQIDSAYYPGADWDGIAINKNSCSSYIYVDFVSLFTSYIAGFNDLGTQIWVDSIRGQAGVLNLVYDGNNNIYGTAVGYGFIVFKGDTIKSNIGGNINIIFKLDTLGNLKWTFNLDADFSSAITMLTLLPNGRLAATGTVGDIILHGSDTLINPLSDGQSPFLVIIDTNGNKLYALNHLRVNGFYNGGRTITSDSANNIYLGGYVSDSIYVKGIPAYHNTGGESDFFIVKYGYNCNCTISSEPTPDFSYSGSGTVTFTYTGTTTPDSLRWDFGDGSTSNSINPSHNFHDTGQHHVCLTVYACDSGTYCEYVHTTVSVPIFTAQPVISVYPNPISGAFFIEGAEIGTTVRLFNIIGQDLTPTLSKGEGVIVINSNRQQINTNDLRVGTYVLQLINKEGVKESVTVVKQ